MRLPPTMMSRRPTSHSQRSAFVRALVLLVAALCAVVQLAGAAHFLVVRHTVCPEHGELVHEGAGHASAAGRAPLARADRQLATVDATGGSEEDHAHDHCALLSQRVDSLAAARVSYVLTASSPAPAIEAPGFAPRELAPVRRSTLLLYAPKSSPPLALFS